jgi:hypothetical protein
VGQNSLRNPITYNHVMCGKVHMGPMNNRNYGSMKGVSYRLFNKEGIEGKSTTMVVRR